jgi:hypothetical protein
MNELAKHIKDSWFETKTARGHDYLYYRWRESGRKCSMYIGPATSVIPTVRGVVCGQHYAHFYIANSEKFYYQVL